MCFVRKINIPSKVKTLSAHVFHQCTSLISITIDEGVETILDRAFFECKKLQSIVLPSSLKVIDTSVFLNCTSLKAITIPEKVYKIGNGIIVGCSSISSVEFKNTTDWYKTQVSKEIVKCPLSPVFSIYNLLKPRISPSQEFESSVTCLDVFLLSPFFTRDFRGLVCKT